MRRGRNDESASVSRPRAAAREVDGRVAARPRAPAWLRALAAARAQVHADADNAHDDETSVRAELKRAHADAAEMRAAAAHVAEAFAADGGAARRTRRTRPPAALGLVAAARGVSHERVALPCSGARAQRRISPSLPAHWHVQEMSQRQCTHAIGCGGMG